MGTRYLAPVGQGFLLPLVACGSFQAPNMLRVVPFCPPTPLPQLPGLIERFNPVTAGLGGDMFVRVSVTLGGMWVLSGPQHVTCGPNLAVWFNLQDSPVPAGLGGHLRGWAPLHFSPPLLSGSIKDFPTSQLGCIGCIGIFSRVSCYPWP